VRILNIFNKIVGKFLVFSERWKYWLGNAQLLMIMYLFIKEFRHTTYLGIGGIWWTILGFITLTLLAIYDYFVWFPSMQNAWTDKTPLLVEMNERLKRLEAKK